MNFYASREFFALVSEAYFKGRRTSVEDVRIGDAVLRLLVVDRDRVITEVPFLDYHQPLADAEVSWRTRVHGYARWVTRDVIEESERHVRVLPGMEAAPYVDWSQLPSFEQYLALIKMRCKGVLKEHARRRRRLAEDFGELTFCADDPRDDAFDLARRWKRRQLLETGANDYLANPQTVEYLRLARKRRILLSSTLRAAGRLLSVWMGFVHDGVWSGWIFAYDHDPQLRKYSVGHQLLRSMVEESYRRKHRQFDFSIGGEEYKWIYSTHARLVGPIGCAPFSQRVFTLAREHASRALSVRPSWLALARGLRARAASLPRMDRARRIEGEET